MILIVGALSPPNGGATISLAEYEEFLKNDSRFVFFDAAQLKPIKMYKYVELIVMIARSSIASFHVSDQAAVYKLPFLYLIARLFNTKVIYRQFGGGFSNTYQALGCIRRWVVNKTILRSNYIYFQSKYLVNFFSTKCSNDVTIRWLPTSRINRFTNLECWEKKDPTNIIFLGSVTKEKGVYELIEAVQHVDDYFLNIYGPCDDKLLISRLKNSVRCEYHGEVTRAGVTETLKQRSIFALPSYHPGEGYSGAVIEATFSGLPLILSRWNAFPEMFSEEEVMFVSPKSVESIVKRLVALREHPNLLSVYSEKSFIASERFKLKNTIKQFIEDHLICAEY